MELATLLKNAIEGWYGFDTNLEGRDLASVAHLHLESAQLDHRGLFIRTLYFEQRIEIDDTLVWFSNRVTLTFCFDKQSRMFVKSYVRNGLPDHVNPASWYDCETKTIRTESAEITRLVSLHGIGNASRTLLEKYLELHSAEDDFQAISSIAKTLLVPSGFKYFPLFRLFLPAVVEHDDNPVMVSKKPHVLS